MSNEIIPYIEMCRREGVSLQRGMNFQLGHNHSVILMSVRPNAPYADRFEDDGSSIVYEGHDFPKSKQNQTPKMIDQPQFTPSVNYQKMANFTKLPRNTKLAGSHQNE